MNRRRFFTRLVGASIALTTAARLSLEPAAKIFKRSIKDLSLEEIVKLWPINDIEGKINRDKTAALFDGQCPLNRTRIDSDAS